MCGRFVAVSSPQLLAGHFDVDDVDVGDRVADYNVTPRAEVPVVVSRGDRRALETARWGLVPPWADDVRIGDRLINARAETVAGSSAFAAAFRRRRCIVAADGFYEWQRRPGRPGRPYFLRRADGEPLAFAGLWEVWRDRGSGGPGRRPAPVVSCTIVTTAASTDVEAVHHRMPVVLARDGWQRWLDPSAGAGLLDDLLAPAPAGTLVSHRVSPRVNQPANNDALLVARFDEADVEETDVLTLFD